MPAESHHSLTCIFIHCSVVDGAVIDVGSPAVLFAEQMVDIDGVLSHAGLSPSLPMAFGVILMQS